MCQGENIAYIVQNTVQMAGLVATHQDASRFGWQRPKIPAPKLQQKQAKGSLLVQPHSSSM
jgi:hypothetical protein